MTELSQSAQEAIDLLKAMIAIPSTSRHEGPMADFLAQEMERLFPRWSLSRLGHSLLVDSGENPEGPTLLLCSHIDTVEALDSWTKNPFVPTVEGDRLYGLGANDAGASLVSLVAAARRVGRPDKGRFLIALVAEEEVGDQGFYTIESKLPRYDAAIFGEPTDMKMASSMRGAMKAMMRSRGIGCHASTPWLGHNAVDQLVADVAKLRTIDLKDGSLWGQATIEPTIVQGGKTSNQIPALMETTLDIRTTPEKDNDWILRQLKETELEIEILFNRRRPMFNPPDSRLVKAFEAACPGEKECVFDGTCDMAFARAPSIILGPGELKIAHVADEYTSLAAIDHAITVYERVFRAFWLKPEMPSLK